MIIERFNRTIRDKISKYQLLHKTKSFIDEINNLVDSYNNTEHSTINLTPKQAKEQKHQDVKTQLEKFEIINEIKETLKIGDIVRVLRDKKVFEKG